MKNFIKFHADHPLLLRSQAYKFWKEAKKVAIELLRAEMKKDVGRGKVIGKRYIRVLKEGL